MPQLVWDEADFIACLEVLPEVGEYDVSHHFKVERDGLRLELSVYQFDSDIYITLYHMGIERPLIDFRIIGCSGTRYVNYQRGEYLEFAPAKVFGDRYSRNDPIPVGVRLTAKPHFQIQLFVVEFDGLVACDSYSTDLTVVNNPLGESSAYTI